MGNWFDGEADLDPLAAGNSRNWTSLVGLRLLALRLAFQMVFDKSIDESAVVGGTRKQIHLLRRGIGDEPRNGARRRSGLRV